MSLFPSLSLADEDLIYWDEHRMVRQEKGKDIALYVDAQFKRAREGRTYQERWDAYVTIQEEIPEELILKEETDVIQSATSVIPSEATRSEARDLPSQESARLIAWKEMRELLKNARKRRRSKSAYQFLHAPLGVEPPEKPFKEAYEKATEDIKFTPYDGFEFSWLLASYLPTKTGGLWVERMGDAFVERGYFLRAYAQYKAIKDYSIAYNQRIEKKLRYVKARLGHHLNEIEKASALEGLKLTDGTLFRAVTEKRGMHKEKVPYLEITFFKATPDTMQDATQDATQFFQHERVVRKRIYDFELSHLTSKKYGPLLIRDGDRILLVSEITGSLFVFDLNGMLLEKKPVTEEIASRYEVKSTINEFLFAKDNFALIPKGTFQMGSPPDEEGRRTDETLHTVTLTKDFYLQKTEVTQLQWYLVMGETPSYFRGRRYCEEDWDEGLQICPNHPVKQVSWEDVRGFIQKLNGMQKEYVYRLPTEAEWEYAARLSGVSEEKRRKFLTPDGSLDIRESDLAKTAYGFGNSEDCLEGYAWYCKNSDYQTHSVLDSRIEPIGGLYNMHGNVWEWVSNWYEEAYSTETVIDPKGPQTGSYRVIRGGGWGSYPQALRSASRNNDLPGDRFNRVGCRLLRQ